MGIKNKIFDIIFTLEYSYIEMRRRSEKFYGTFLKKKNSDIFCLFFVKQYNQPMVNSICQRQKDLDSNFLAVAC